VVPAAHAEKAAEKPVAQAAVAAASAAANKPRPMK
jgi:hypothetical protein